MKKGISRITLPPKKTAAVDQLQHPEDELNLNTDGKINPGEKQTNDKITKNEKIRRSNRESRQPNRYGVITYTKNFWV